MSLDILDEADVEIPAGLFPLPLTMFERYMFADDRPDYPMGFVIEMALSGLLCRKTFEVAIDLATRRHPLLRATISNTSRRLMWENKNQRPEIDWLVGTGSQESNSTGFINLKNDPGFKTTVWMGNEKSKVSFLFHHAVVDGVGATHFIGDLLAIYGQRTRLPESDDQQVKLSTVDPLILRQRGELSAKGALTHSWRKTFGHLIEFLWCYPTGIAKKGSKNEIKSTLLQPFRTRSLSRAQLLMITKEAARLNVTPNDIYVASLFQTIKSWNARQGQKRFRACYRVGIPANLRTPSHDGSPAANMISFVFLNQRDKTIGSRGELIQNLHKRISQILSSTASRLPLYCLKISQIVPGFLSLFLNLPLRFSTATLANVGNVQRQLNSRFPMHQRKCIAGSVRLEGIFGAAPIRKGTPIGISVGVYGGELFMNFNCDPRYFSNEEAEQFADLFVTTLLDVGDHQHSADHQQ